MRFETPSLFLVRDEFDQSAGDLNGKTLPSGQTWAAALDFDVETTGKTATRSVSDSVGSVARAGSTTYAAIAVQADVSCVSAVTGGPGVAARYVDADNFLAAYIATNSTMPGVGSNRNVLTVRKEVAASVTTLGQADLGPFVSSLPAHTIRLVADAAGRWFAWGARQGSTFGRPLLIGMDAVLTTGGALDDGLLGLFDVNNSGATPARNWDFFFGFAPTPSAACFAGQSLEIRHDRAERENPTGTTWNRVPSRRGRYLRFAPGGAEGRSNRFFLKAVRGPEVQPGVWIDPNIDDIAVDLYATPLGVAVPEP